MTLPERKPLSGFDTPARPMYEREPLREIPLLPQIDPKNKMTVALYRGHRKPVSFRCIGSDLILKGVILEEIEKRPQIWKAHHRLTRLKDCLTEVAVDVFRRTEVLLTIETIQKFFKQTKDQLRRKLRKSSNGNRSLLDIEERLYDWDLYGFARFLRSTFTNYENKLSKQNVIELSSDSEGYDDIGVMVEEVSEDEDLQLNEGVSQVDEEIQVIDLKHRNDVRNEKRMPSFHLKQEVPMEFQSSSGQHSFSAFSSMPQSSSDHQSYQHRQSSLVRPSSPRIDYVLPKRAVLSRRNTQEEHMDWYADDPNMDDPTSENGCVPMRQSMEYQPPVLPPITQSDITQINEQILRVGRNQPHKVPLLRKALFDVILQFDLKDYTSVKELFHDLGNA